jgi:hypothetical protein
MKHSFLNDTVRPARRFSSALSSLRQERNRKFSALHIPSLQVSCRLSSRLPHLHSSGRQVLDNNHRNSNWEPLLGCVFNSCNVLIKRLGLKSMTGAIPRTAHTRHTASCFGMHGKSIFDVHRFRGLVRSMCADSNRPCTAMSSNSFKTTPLEFALLS